MSVLIEGMEMSKNCEIIIRIDEKGEVYIYDQYPTKIYKAVPVPPHGRLIDADALMNDGWTLHKQVIRMGGYAIHEMPLNNPNVPIVIPADKDGKDGG